MKREDWWGTAEEEEHQVQKRSRCSGRGPAGAEEGKQMQRMGQQAQRRRKSGNREGGAGAKEMMGQQLQRRSRCNGGGTVGAKEEQVQRSRCREGGRAGAQEKGEVQRKRSSRQRGESAASAEEELALGMLCGGIVMIGPCSLFPPLLCLQFACWPLVPSESCMLKARDAT